MKLLKRKDGMFVLEHSPEDKKILEETPVGRVFPPRPLVLQNVVKRLGMDINVIPPKIKELPEDFVFHTRPYPHQEHALKLMHTFPGSNLLLDPGLGKTKILLDYLWLKKYSHVLVVAPSPLLDVWEEQGKLHRPEVTLLQVRSGKEELPPSGILTMSYRMATLQWPRLLFWKPKLIILDEALIQNDSKATEAMLSLGRIAEERILASGTLVNNSAAQLFYPLQFSEPSLVGRSRLRFRDRYLFTEEITVRTGGEKRTVTVELDGCKNVEELKEVVRSVSIVMRKDDILDLPKKIHNVTELPMPEEYSYHWNNILSNSVVDLGEGKVLFIDNPLSAASRLSQLSAGFFYDEDRAIYELSTHPKMEAILEDLLSSRARSLVWFRYKAEGQIFQEKLRNEGIIFDKVDGSTPNVSAHVRHFNGTETQVLLAQERVLNYGQTIMGDETQVFPYLESTVSRQYFLSETYSSQVSIQQEDRTHRIGLTFQPVYNRYLLTPLDHLIRKRLESRKNVSDQILETFIRGWQEESIKSEGNHRGI